MAENPALPIWTDAYLADTHPGLSLELHGCYFLMMMLAWRLPGCRLPDDDNYIAARLGIPISRWKRKFRPEMEKFWQVSGGHWTQKRLTREHEYVQSKKQQTSSAGKASARKRKQTVSTDVAPPLQQDGNEVGNETATALRCNETATPTPTPTPLEEKYQKEFDGWYEAFPRHTGRGQAVKAYRTARKKADAETLLAGAQHYAEQRTDEDPKFTKHPATWLNGECWLDEAGEGDPETVGAMDEAERARQQRAVREASFAETGYWEDDNDDWGPRPDAGDSDNQRSTAKTIADSGAEAGSLQASGDSNPMPDFLDRRNGLEESE